MVGIQVSTALQFAHSRGILHRDVKPANILIDTNNNAWITDFGLAKPVDGENLTESGDIAGTIRYLAPERLQGKCDCRSDVYALGLVLLELITRRPAWDGANGAVLVKKLTDGDTCPFPVEANVPTDLRLIIKKAIQPHPEMRYQSALEMAEDLTLFVDGRPISARRFSRLHSAQLWARRNPTVAALWTTTILTLVVGTIAATALAINWRTAATIATLREQEATTERDRATDSLALTREALAEMTSSVVARFLSRREQLTDSDREFLNKILEYHQQLGKLAATEEWARAVEAHGLRDVSKIRHLLGQIDQAADELRRSISMFDDLAEDYPETPEYRMEAAGVLLNLGRYLAENQRLDDALDCFQRASHAFALLPPIASFQSRIDGDHATAENNIANIHTMRRNYEDAEIGYNKAIVIQRDLLSSDSESIEHRTGLARSLSNLANCLIKAGRLTDAAGIANEALSLRIEIAEQTNDPNHRLAVEGSWVILGRLHKSLDEFDKAAECLLKAESISAQLSADFPAVPKYRSRWSSSLGELAELSVQIGKSEKAIEYYERLILVRKQLTLEVPSQLNFHGWLAEAQDSLARLLKDTKPTMAVELWQQAIAGFTHIIEVDNSLLWAHEECNDSLVRMASCRWESLYDSTSALPLFEQAELTWKKLADENPENTRFRVWQSGIARNIGQILVEQGKLEQGLIRLRQALAIAEGIQPEQESYATARGKRRVHQGGDHNGDSEIDSCIAVQPIRSHKSINQAVTAFFIRAVDVVAKIAIQEMNYRKPGFALNISLIS